MKGRLDGLDALRGIAAFSVLAYHYVPGLFPGGYIAVDFFFMLSGYVMARTYEDRLRDGLSPLSFFAARYRRLWPVMFFAGTLALPMYLASGGEPWIAVLNLALLPVLIGWAAFPLNTLAWSIFLELLANAIHCSVIARIDTGKVAVLVGACAGLLGWIVLATDHYNPGGGPLWSVLAGIPRVLLSYLLGVVLYRIWRDEPPVSISPSVTLGILPAILLAATFAGSFHPGLLIPFVLLVCPVMIAGGLQFNAGRVGSMLGAMSFPLYAVHLVMLQYFTALPAALASLALAAALSWRSLKTPRHRLSAAVVRSN